MFDTEPFVLFVLFPKVEDYSTDFQFIGLGIDLLPLKSPENEACSFPY